MWGGTFSGGWHVPGWFDFGPYLVDGWQGVASIQGKAKVSSSLKPLELQYYVAPFFKAAKYQKYFVALCLWVLSFCSDFVAVQTTQGVYNLITAVVTLTNLQVQ